MKRLGFAAALLLGTALFAAPGARPGFSSFDTNGDGKITQSEFEATQQSRMAAQAESGKMMRNAGNAPQFGDIDTDNNGVIDANEFKTHQQTRMQNRPGKGQNMGFAGGKGQGGGPNR